MLLAPEFLYAVGLAILVWLLAISVWLYKIWTHYTRLVGKIGKRDLRNILESLITQNEKTQYEIKRSQQSVKQLADKTQTHVQKIGLVRFNPYNDTGGNQSFALALLDSRDTGVVVLSLHSREGTRLYIKSVTGGKSLLSLSKEEKQAVAQAK